MPSKDPFSLDFDFRSALELYLYFEPREDELSGAPAALLSSLKAYLYARLSIEEMERPHELLARLDGRNAKSHAQER
jgi:hypothetical protein